MPDIEAARHISFDVLDSTNAEAMRRAGAGERGPLWTVAARQSAGRGRHGRTWVSGPGNLYATLLLSLPVSAHIAAQTSFVAALAVHDSAAAVLAHPEHLALKWPNDVLLDGRKVSGILIETVAQDGTDGTMVAIGIGINLVQAPAHTRYGATSLAEHGAHMKPAEAFARLTAALSRRLADWNDGRGFAAIRSQWVARAAGLGRPVSVTLGGRTVTGEFRGLASDGALLLSEAGGREHAVHAGDVSLSLQGATPGSAEAS
jgi:BirA family transcriptional regulator, biotin operon repressor / biotin---[acetyl-CoA-carboxylase] ligase